MQIHSRPVVIFQLILFCLLSPYYLHLAESLIHGVSSLDLLTVKTFAFNHPIALALAALSAISVWRMSKYANLFAFLLVICSLFIGMQLALVDLNKIILLMTFIYAITAYYLVMLYRVETNSAAYNPLYSHQTIGQRSEYDLPCMVRIGEDGYLGQLTNWDENGCFVSLTPGEAGLVDLRGDVKVEVRLDGHTFTQEGNVVSSYERGVGIRFTHAAKDQGSLYNWEEYFKIIDDRGYAPRSREA